MNRVRCRYFTLIELLVALAVFAMLSTFLYQILHRLQQFWLRTGRVLEVHENARTAFNAIEYDLKGIVAGNLEGEKILVDAAGTGVRDVAFICNKRSAGSSISSLYEVGYEVDSYQLKQWETGDSDGSKWNFLNNNPEAWAANGSWGSTRTIIDGVVDFQFQFYWSSSTSPYFSPYNVATDSDLAPDIAEVSLTLIHPNTIDQSVVAQERTKRTFTTRFQLNNY